MADSAVVSKALDALLHPWPKISPEHARYMTFGPGCPAIPPLDVVVNMSRVWRSMAQYGAVYAEWLGLWC